MVYSYFLYTINHDDQKHFDYNFSVKREEQIEGFVEEIWQWFARHKRELLWRDLPEQDDTERAYQILVSEVMLQQTQVSRVITIFKRFLEQFPTIRDLACASNKEVILVWRGMGYNSRALRLRDAAKLVVDEHKGQFPKDMDQLLCIKGIGEYTAAAIRNFAFNLPTPCLDTNIRRILHRVFVGPEHADGTWRKSDRELMKIAEDVLNAALQGENHITADWHAALMDFGSLVCTKTSPKWELCPLTAKGLCKASFKVPSITVQRAKRQKIKEPGRTVGSTFIPNRIFRGKIVEELRDAEHGLKLKEIGQRICIDWSDAAHGKWLEELLQKLVQDQLLMQKHDTFALENR